jgi:hypothetical protein
MSRNIETRRQSQTSSHSKQFLANQTMKGEQDELQIAS